jgi:hypothetical protein
MDAEILQLNSDVIYIGTSNGKKSNTEFFYGLISDIEIYDIALEPEEIKEIYLNPKKPKIRDFGNFKSSGFLYAHILPELSNGKTCIDLSNNFSVTLENIYLYKSVESFRTFLPKPHRRNSRFLSLKHKSNSSAGNKWIHKETRKNQIKFHNEVRQDILNYRIEGLNTLRFEELSKEETELVTKVLVKI